MSFEWSMGHSAHTSLYRRGDQRKNNLTREPTRTWTNRNRGAQDEGKVESLSIRRKGSLTQNS